MRTPPISPILLLHRPYVRASDVASDVRGPLQRTERELRALNVTLRACGRFGGSRGVSASCRDRFMNNPD